MEQLTLFPEDSPANRSAWQGKERAQRMTGISGRRLCELLEKSGPAGLCLKTLLDSSPYWNQRVYLRWELKRLSFIVRTATSKQVLPSFDYSEELSEQSLLKSGQQDIVSRNFPMAHQSCCVYQLAPSEHHTAGIGSSLLPTPTTTDHMAPKSDRAIIREMTEIRPGRTQLSNLRDVVTRQPERLPSTSHSNPADKTHDPSDRNLSKPKVPDLTRLQQLQATELLPHRQPPATRRADARVRIRNDRTIPWLMRFMGWWENLGELPNSIPYLWSK